MNNEEFREAGYKLIDWIADYRENMRDLPVRPTMVPGEIYNALPTAAPEEGDSFDNIMADLDKLILPGVTHWQHPRFSAYFPSNAAPESILGELAMAGLNMNTFAWETSPAGVELEDMMMAWLRDACGLPKHWEGVIQTTASEATLVGMIMAREAVWERHGRDTAVEKLTAYYSAEAHSSVEKSCKIIGLPMANVRAIKSDGQKGMQAAELKRLIAEDVAKGLIPTAFVATFGSTSTGIFDDMSVLGPIAKAAGMFIHVDAAWAGSAAICPEYAHWFRGVELADSYCFNPHKWLGVQFDCSSQFVADPKLLIKAVGVDPEYLRRSTGSDGDMGYQAKDYRNWGVPLGRRARALKLWFTLRGKGLEALRTMLRTHVQWSEQLCEMMRNSTEFEIITEPSLAIFSFAMAADDMATANDLTRELIARINRAGFVFLTKTDLQGRIVIRWQIGSALGTWDDVLDGFNHVKGIAKDLLAG